MVVWSNFWIEGGKFFGEWWNLLWFLFIEFLYFWCFYLWKCFVGVGGVWNYWVVMCIWFFFWCCGGCKWGRILVKGSCYGIWLVVDFFICIFGVWRRCGGSFMSVCSDEICRIIVFGRGCFCSLCFIFGGFGDCFELFGYLGWVFVVILCSGCVLLFLWCCKSWWVLGGLEGCWFGCLKLWLCWGGDFKIGFRLEKL